MCPNPERRTPNSELDFSEALARLDEQGLRRQLSAAEEAGPTRLVLGGKSYLNFASNDYLGLAQHPEVREAAKVAIDRFGVGSGASRLVTGSHRLMPNWKRKLPGGNVCRARWLFPAAMPPPLARSRPWPARTT
jgi:hypothetical protein